MTCYIETGLAGFGKALAGNFSAISITSKNHVLVIEVPSQFFLQLNYDNRRLKTVSLNIQFIVPGFSIFAACLAVGRLSFL